MQRSMNSYLDFDFILMITIFSLMLNLHKILLHYSELEIRNVNYLCLVVLFLHNTAIINL